MGVVVLLKPTPTPSFPLENSGLAKFIEEYNVGINIDPNIENFDEELKKLDNKESLEKIYKNIENVNNNIANIKAVAKSYSDLI